MRFARWSSAIACCNMGGYISVDSWVSPSMAARRLSAVDPTPSRALRCPSAWIVSASAPVRKNRATLVKPSASAFFANARYFRFAWLSASLKLMHDWRRLRFPFGHRYGRVRFNPPVPIRAITGMPSP
jgi:hypothetical protein